MEFMSYDEIKSLKNHILCGDLPNFSSVISEKHRNEFETVSAISIKKLDDILFDCEINNFPFKKTLAVSNVFKTINIFHALKKNYITEKRFSSFIEKSFLDHRTGEKSPSASYLFNQEFEFEASSILNEKLGKDYQIKYCGRCISPKFPLISCRPDGFVVKNGRVKSLVEIKSPQVLRHITIDEWLSKKNFNDFRIKNDKIILKKNTYIYDQIQMSLAICNLNVCELVYYSPKNYEILHLKVYKNQSYIQRKINIISEIFNEFIFDFFKKYL